MKKIFKAKFWLIILLVTFLSAGAYFGVARFLNRTHSFEKEVDRVLKKQEIPVEPVTPLQFEPQVESVTLEKPENMEVWRASWIGLPVNNLTYALRSGLDFSGASWITFPYSSGVAGESQRTVNYRTVFTLSDNGSGLTQARFWLTGVNEYILYVNAQEVGRNYDWQNVQAFQIGRFLKVGSDNEIVVRVTAAKDKLSVGSSEDNFYPALIGQLVVEFDDGTVLKIPTNSSWLSVDFNNSPDNWQAVRELGAIGMEPWSDLHLYSVGSFNLENRWLVYRKKVVLADKPKSVIVKIGVDSKYWLWINGQLAVFEGSLKRGPNPNDTYYDRVDLSKYFVQGENTIAVLTWYFGKDGFSHKSSGQPGLIFQANIDNQENILSDASWLVTEHPAFGNTLKPYPNFRLSESNIYFDSRLDMSEWQKPEFSSASWQNATEFGIPPVAPWNGLVERSIPLWRDLGLKDYASTDTIANSDATIVAAKLPKNLTITPYFKIKAPVGLKIEIRTDDYSVGGENNLRAEYITRDGVQEFESPAYLNGHVVYYNFPDGVEIISLQYRETRYDTEWLGKFASDDEFLNILWQKSLNTLNLNLRDGIQDPDRERAQWWGDAVIILKELFYSADTAGHAIIRKAIADLINWQKQNGVLYSPVPSGSWQKELPLQMLSSIGRYGLGTYFLYTGDEDLIKKIYPNIRTYLSLWQFDKNGLVIHRSGDWNWADWGEGQDYDLLTNAWYYLALETAEKFAALSGDENDAKIYEALRLNMREQFNLQFWTSDGYRSPANTGLIDERGNALAVLAGLADDDKWETMKKIFHDSRQSSPYFEKYVLEAMLVMHDDEAAILRLKERYNAMVVSDYSTLWEFWELGGSYNHAWSGGPMVLMAEYLAGIEPEEPSFSRYHVLPQMGSLQNIESVVPTVKGNIEINIKRDNVSFRLNLKSPNDTVAVVGFPKNILVGKDFTTININNKLVWQKKENSAAEFLDNIFGVEYLGEDEYYYKFSVSAGSWELVGE